MRGEAWPRLPLCPYDSARPPSPALLTLFRPCPSSPHHVSPPLPPPPSHHTLTPCSWCSCGCLPAGRGASTAGSPGCPSRPGGSRSRLCSSYRCWGGGRVREEGIRESSGTLQRGLSLSPNQRSGLSQISVELVQCGISAVRHNSRFPSALLTPPPVPPLPPPHTCSVHTSPPFLPGPHTCTPRSTRPASPSAP